MKQLKTKVLLSAFVLIFALVATIGSTFAWFTISTSVEIEAMELNVSTENSLLIKVWETGEDFTTETLLDASNYKTFIPIEDILASYANLADWRLSPVTVINAGYTGIDGKTFNVLTTPNTDFDRSLSAAGGTVVNDADGYVIELKFWVLSQGADPAPLILQDLVVSNNGAATADGVETAVRLAVKAADGAETEGEAYVFGLTNDYGFTYVENLPGYYTGAVYDGTTSLLGFNSLSQLTQGYDAQGTYTNFVEEVLNADTNNGVFFGSADVNFASTTDDSLATEIYTLNQDTPTLVTVTIFVEGWAAGAVNNIIAANFNISWKFALYYAA